ncbi:hypothetical protein [Franzmannia pantelleriensis]|nr:hypothetical protein [Halomonas pantelleriensis]
MPFKDQAAGLREWADEHVVAASGTDEHRGEAPRPPEARASAAGSSEASRALMVLGLPGDDTARVYRLLQAWCDSGQVWVGDPGAWRVVPLRVESPHLSTLAAQQTRWALWVDSDPEAFRRSYRLLRQLAERGGPSCLLVLHPRLGVSRGLLNNLRQAAAEFLGIRLLMVRQQGAEGQR